MSSSLAQRQDRFQRRVQEFSKNDLETHIRGYRKDDQRNKPKSHLITIRAVNDIAFPAQIRATEKDVDLSAEFHLSLFY